MKTPPHVYICEYSIIYICEYSITFMLNNIFRHCCQLIGKKLIKRLFVNCSRNFSFYSFSIYRVNVVSAAVDNLGRVLLCGINVMPDLHAIQRPWAHGVHMQSSLQRDKVCSSIPSTNYWITQFLCKSSNNNWVDCWSHLHCSPVQTSSGTDSHVCWALSIRRPSWWPLVYCISIDGTNIFNRKWYTLPDVDVNFRNSTST